jgi:ectoine hydroxylase-related dioxygenase (phytanoyl-CoA dioxygenase family)
MSNVDFIQLKTYGYTILKSSIDLDLIKNLEVAVDNSISKHNLIKSLKFNRKFDDGVASNVLLDDLIYIDLLKYIHSIGLITTLNLNFFGSNSILNSISALNNSPNNQNFTSLVHRDIRFFSGLFPIMLNFLIMVDNFNSLNGGTLILPKSHLLKDKPTDSDFALNSIQISGSKGDLLIFDSNLWHASAPNISNSNRRAIPLTISKSFVKQLFDYPKALGNADDLNVSQGMQQFLGYHSRIPSTLDEWYVSDENRFYKKNQD